MLEWSARVWVVLSLCYSSAASMKHIDLFLDDHISLSINKELLQLSDYFDIVIRSKLIEEDTFCANIPNKFVSEKGQTALFMISSKFREVPNCRKDVQGNVVLAKVEESKIAYGSVFTEEPKFIEGQMFDLVRYLNDITTSRDIFYNVGDRYSGVKEHVSLSDAIEVPIWIALPLSIILLVLICISIALCIKKPNVDDQREKYTARKRIAANGDKDLAKKNEEPTDRFVEDVKKGDGSFSENASREDGGKKLREGVDPSSDNADRKGKTEKESKQHTSEKAKSLPSCALRKRGRLEMIVEPVTSKEFEVYLYRLAQFTIDYYDNPTAYNVTPSVVPGFLYNTMPKEPPEDPERFEEIYDDIKTKIMPGLTHWQHPNFFGYYPIGRCYPDMLADFITSALSVIGFSWDTCPALTEMEQAMINWVGRAFGIPENFLFQDSPESSQGGGTVTESASDAIFCAVLAARQWKINQVVEEQHRTGGMKYDTIHDIAKRLVVYCSRDAHSCIEKACKLAMLRCRPIQPKEENQWGITGEEIEEQIKKDINRELIPCFIDCTLGTIPTASCDKLTSIWPVAKKYGLWLHVDAAYAGSTFIDPKNREVAEGMEHAQTINVNLSKFLLHSATLSIIWTREQKIYKDAFATHPVYLKPSHASAADQRDWGLHLSRRFKALKIWFIMRLCGVEGLRRYVSKIYEMASYFELLVDQHPNLQIFTTRNFGLFTFQYFEPNFSKLERNMHTLRLLRFFNDSHKIFLTHGRVADNYIIRVSMSYERTTKETIDSAFSIMKAMTEEYKKRKGDPTLIRAPAAINSETSAPPTDADFSIVAVKKSKSRKSEKLPEQALIEAISTLAGSKPSISQTDTGNSAKSKKEAEVLTDVKAAATDGSTAGIISASNVQM